MIRLQKILSAAGVASRRASEQLILEGRITVNGEVIRTLGTKAEPGADIRVDGRRIKSATRQRYIALYKPKGYVTTRSDPEGRPTVIDLLGDAGYIYPVGRLDYDSEGLLLLTTDGDLAARLMHPRHEVEKEYEVIVAGVPDPAAIDKLRRGVFIDRRRTAPAHVHAGHVVKSAHPTTRLTITIHEGRNRQIRKMCSAVGLPVRDLRRVRMGSVEIGHLRPGQWRDLTPREIGSLKRLLRGSVATEPASERSEQADAGRRPAPTKRRRR
jgi:pseudouridine synthase